LGFFTEPPERNIELTIAIKASELVLGHARIGLLVWTAVISMGSGAILWLEAELVCDLYGLHEQYVIIHRAHITSVACAEQELGCKERRNDYSWDVYRKEKFKMISLP